MKQDWQISTIGSVAKVFNGNSINAEVKKAKYEGLEEGYPFIATKDVGVNGEVDYDNGVKIPFDADFKIAMPDAVFVCAEGGSAGKKVAHIDRKVCFGNKLFALQPVKEKVKGGFLYYAVQEAGFKAQFRLSMAGIIGGVSAKKFNSITIPIPPLSEQQRIVALLDAEFAKIDALKANAEKNLQNAKDLFQAALKKELEPKDGWDKKQLGNIAEFKNGLNFGKEHGCRKYHFLGVGDFKGNTMVETDKLSYIYQDSIDPDYYLKDNDIVFVRSNGSRHLVGRSLLIKSGNEPSVFSGFCIRCRFISSIVLPQFAMRFFSIDTTKRILTSSGGGCNISNLNQKVLSALKIPFPTSIDEQANIVSRIEQMESHCKTLQANYEKTLSLCDNLKQALLRKAFNGEI